MKIGKAAGPAASWIVAALFFGGCWGAAEATLGHLLHLLGRFVPTAGLAGLVLFPVGVFFMLQAWRWSGRRAAILAAAATAAALKLSSAALPGVGWLFAANPALSILAEGLVVFAGAPLLAARRPAAPLPAAFFLAVAWRLAFLLLIAALPVPKGMLAKGPGVLLPFLLLEPAANALLIGLGVKGAGETPRVDPAFS